ncbi:MAG TPA: beta-galactosidase [Terriglobia bacterium]|nr:beta-galactosidase [Terriglobia bacterium]
MPKNPEPSRREFLSHSGKLVVGEALFSIPAAPSLVFPHEQAASSTKAVPKSWQKISEFLLGASVYPELQTRDEWNAMLDRFQHAHMNCVRVSESSWGNLETAPGHYDFGWLQHFLDDLEKRKMRAILGTGSYVPPQWLAAESPEILIQPHPGVKAHPMARHAPCLNHPSYRSALRRYILAIGKEFKDHPMVIGWQLGNEEEGSIKQICYNPACEGAWREWLRKTYHTPEEFNRRLDLESWGMKVDSLATVPQPGEGVEESGAQIAALTLAHRHFRRDVLLNFFLMQTEALREAGVQQWILTDWNTLWDAVADDPLAATSMDIAGLNDYQTREDNSNFWTNLTWHQDMHRTAYGRTHFITTENRFGVTGDTHIYDPSPSREQFLMWGLEAAAFGTCGLFYWTGNRWRGGHWPHWGGLLDWSGHPEPDFDWTVELGKIFAQWGKHLIDNPVKATAVVLTDFDQRVALEIYPHITSSLTVLPQCFDALHRLGIGVDSMNLATAATPANLRKYSLVLIPAATAMDNGQVTASLLEFTQGGGAVIVTPFTSYMDKDGIFRRDGFAANLRELTGGLVRTIRWMGSSNSPSPARIHSFGSGSSSVTTGLDPEVEWKGGGLSGFSAVGLEGYCEFLEVDSSAERIATFKSGQAILDGRPAATQRKTGRGAVVKLGFWPGDDSLLRLINQLVPESRTIFAGPAPQGVVAVPHADSSLFVVNTTGHEIPVHLARAVADRLSGANVTGNAQLQPYQVLWLA